MRIIDQYHEILKTDSLEQVERAGRTCYKSESKIGCSLYDKEEECMCIQNGGECHNCQSHSSTTFIKQLIKRGHEAMLEHAGATVRFVTNRGITHELVRHRLASFGQESTRYVSYGGKDIEFIRPVWVKGTDIPTATFHIFLKACEDAYQILIESGWRPEQAREVLPNALKTEIVITANYREWRHILKLRAIGTTGKPHPQMQALMLPLLEEFKVRVPAMFEDLVI